ncbi:protein FAM3C [Austrofundulus limnaeus]|uniref:Protein FAM3C n=1 Tax=Austrofundulus limnaeus TaxID=52670 RepID=A0A2I4CQI1_AUSLI|nr:PREDICTED: protein FAM3C-like [Austrofundulus limnaeus]
MLSVRVVRSTRGNGASLIRWGLKAVILLVSVIVIVVVVLQFYSDPIKALTKSSVVSSQTIMMTPKQSDGPCVRQGTCPLDHFSFFIQSGAANVVPPKICINDKIVMGTTLNNAGLGINVVKLNGRTGEILRREHYDMYSGSVDGLVEFLKNIDMGSVVLMATYDDPATKLNDEARQLISELGSSAIKTLGFRDNWLFVGGKGVSVKNSFEKHLKNDQSNNKYKDWPELIQLDGCIPKYME